MRSASGVISGIVTATCPEPEGIKKFNDDRNTNIPPGAKRDLEKAKSFGNEEADAVILNLINLFPLLHESLGRHLNGLVQLCYDFQLYNHHYSYTKTHHVLHEIP